MPIFKVSKAADNDLFEIGKYTQDTWGIEQRRKYLKDIDKRFHEIAENPDHPTSRNRDKIKKGCFSISINEHAIIYRKFTYGVRILRILGQSMEWQRHL